MMTVSLAFIFMEQTFLPYYDEEFHLCIQISTTNAVTTERCVFISKHGDASLHLKT